MSTPAPPAGADTGTAAGPGPGAAGTRSRSEPAVGAGSADAAGVAGGAAPAWRRLARRIGGAQPGAAGPPSEPAAGTGPSGLHRVGAHFVIAPGTAPAGAAATGAAPDEAPGGLPAGLTTALARLRPSPQSLVLLAAAPDAATVLLGRLPELTRAAADRGATTLVLAASGLAAAPAYGRRPAEQLAELAGLSVVAPDGMVTLRPDGTLLTTGTAGGVAASWWLCPPAGAVQALGPAWPPAEPAGPAAATVTAAPAADVATAADVEPLLEPTAPTAPAAVETPATGRPPAEASPASPPAPPAATPPEAPGAPAAGAPVAPEPTPEAPVRLAPAAPPAPGAPAVPAAGHTTEATPPAPGPAVPDAAGQPGPDGLLATALPNGFWIRSGSAGLAGPAPLQRATTTDNTVILVVGRPGGPLPTTRQLAAVVRRLLPPAPAELLLSAPWSGVGALTGLAAELAAELDRDVRAAVGLPMRTAGGLSSRLLDADGRATWEPWLTELTASAGTRRVVASAWRSAPAGLPQCGPAVFDTAVPGWWLEAVPAGLWLRPADPGPYREPRLLDPDPSRPRLLVGAGEQPVPAEILAGVDSLLAALAQQGAAEPALVVNGVPRHRTSALGRVLGPAVAPAGPASEPVTAEPAGEHPVTAEPSGARPDERPDQRPDQRPDEQPDERPAQPRPLVAGSATAPDRTALATERTAFRALLGSHFQRCASHADQVATRLPALRSIAREDLKCDLAAVYLHHCDSGVPVTRAELVKAARRSDPGAPAAYLACLGSGLRRLPSHHGAVLLGAHAGAQELRHYRPGTLLTEPAPVVGVPAHDVELGTPVEFALWSVTGRRTSVFAEDGEPEVVFPPGSRFSVLEVIPAQDGLPTRVLLREDGLPASRPRAGSGLPDRRDEHARMRLLAWLARRDVLTPQERRAPDRPDRLHLTPGVAAP
ncbi:hypothetical protein GCM10018781_50190 [Kitasatospora indigofera]|uniref:NAD(+)--protein-arginine ADP-ribosyltransferase n=1 Tax=Kitasatospora indigofera TaxID=67307 RepID=A0A919G3F7_9ACTN|nr:hypothetical protein [Kitasatospora indigofera]GHH77196.1 hypothetical protein GCM10018781_50190 [Kitasatospora indigofera]